MYVTENLNKEGLKNGNYNFIKSEEAKQIYIAVSFLNFKEFMITQKKMNKVISSRPW